MEKILIIEDDFDLAKELKSFINSKGFYSEYVKSFSEILHQVLEYEPNLILLDINLGSYNGFELCLDIRKCYKTPIIFLTGRNNDKDEIMALNLGGDDYLTKPFSKEVLLAHIYRLLETNSFKNINVLKFKNLSLNISKSIIINEQNGKEVSLSGSEFQIMYYLIAHKNSLIPREQLINYLWDNQCYVDENALNVNLSRLRKKLSEIDKKEHLESIRGEGIRIC